MNTRLTDLPKNKTVTIQSISAVPAALQISQEEFETRLFEMGLDIGTPLTLLHEGPFGKDPIAVRVRHCYTVALRRLEASAISVA